MKFIILFFPLLLFEQSKAKSSYW